jgi:Domain of unknown function DUF29
LLISATVPHKRGNRCISEAIVYAYQDGVDLAIQETNLPDITFPAENPYSLSQILDPTFLVNQHKYIAILVIDSVHKVGKYSATYPANQPYYL